MIMWLFFSFIAVALIITIFGFTSDVPIFIFVGTIMVFLLGLNLLNGGLDYKIGETSVASMDVNNITTTTTQDVFENYDDKGKDRLGWFIMILGCLAFILGLYML